MSAADTSCEFSANKSERRYDVDGLSDREVLVLKSMIRLLNQRTQHAWKYVPSTTELLIASDKFSAVSKPATQAQYVLTLGVRSFSQPGFLCSPLNARELETELNRLGDLIVPVLLDSKAAQTEPMRMLRWPPAALLKEPGWLRLATLMTGKQMSIQSLQKSSGESLAACSAFFDELQKASLLVPGDKAQAAPTQTKPHLLLRQTVAPQPNSVQTSLLTRIRMRLGIHGGSAPTQHGGA